MENTFFQLNALLFCFILTVLLYLCNFKSILPNFRSPLTWGYLLIMISILATTGWTLVDGHPELIAWNYAFNIVEFISFDLIGYCWLLYCCDSFLFPVWRKTSTKIIAAIPVLLLNILVLFTYWTGWLFFVDSSGVYHRGPYFFFQPLSYLYMVLSSVLALLSRKKTKFTRERRHFSTIVLFALPPVLLGVVQLAVPPGGFPGMQYSMFMSLLLVFANEQDQMITHDSLTKLLNRYEFERILDERISHFRKNDSESVYVLMGDLDHFKNINDTYGHLEGDIALQTVASTLDALAQDYSAVVARMSGDEFFVLLNAESDTVPRIFIQRVADALQRASKHKPYNLSMSIGLTKYDGKMSFPELLYQADVNMYEVKNRRKHYIA